MGISGLYKFINTNFPDIYNVINMYELRGSACVIDGMQHIYSQLIYLRTRNKEVITDNGQNISHIHGLINSLVYYLKNDVIPIFVFDGKVPEIKKKKIEERKRYVQDNLDKLKSLKNIRDNILSEQAEYLEQTEQTEEFIFGTPPSTSNSTSLSLNHIQEEYNRIYRKAILMKKYYVNDWIEILELLNIPVVKAPGEADPLCAYLLKNNPDIFGIISDDSDMLVFGAPVLMRKVVNQQFVIIELDKILKNIENLLFFEFKEYIKFDLDNLIDFSILLGSDYGNFTLNEYCASSNDILKYYVINNKNYTKIISPDQYDNFIIIKNYYKTFDLFQTTSNYDIFLEKPVWNKPKLMELKQLLLKLNVDEFYIDKNNQLFDYYYSRYNKLKKNTNNINNNTINTNNIIDNIIDNIIGDEDINEEEPRYSNVSMGEIFFLE